MKGPEQRWNDEVAFALLELAQGGSGPGLSKTAGGLVKELPEVKAGRMFGYPALYSAGKMFACAYGNGVGLKLPAGVVSRLLAEGGFEPFQPYGRAPMREWLFFRADGSEAVRAQRHLVEQAANFVAEQARHVGRDATA